MLVLAVLLKQARCLATALSDATAMKLPLQLGTKDHRCWSSLLRGGGGEGVDAPRAVGERRFVF